MNANLAELCGPATRASILGHPSASRRLACEAAFDCLAKAPSYAPVKWERRAAGLAMVKLQF